MNKNIFKVIKAVILGILLYMLLVYSPILFLKANGIKLPQPQEQIEDDPVFHDKKGKKINIHDYNKMMAYDKAEKEGLTSHAECKELYPNPNQGFQREGCHKYITDQKTFTKKIKQGDWGSGKSSAQCEKEVKAYWEPIIQDFKEKGEDFSSDYHYEIDDCEKYDTARISKYVFEPRSRLDDMIKKLQRGESPTEEELNTLTKDRLLVSDYPENHYTIAYFEHLDYFFKLAAKNSAPKE